MRADGWADALDGHQGWVGAAGAAQDSFVELADLIGEGTVSSSKCIPDLVFNVSEPLRLAFLRGYLLGDGTVSKQKISFTTASYDLASGLMYLLSSLGVVASLSHLQPDGVERSIRGEPCITRQPYWTISVCTQNDLRRLESVWADHAQADALRATLACGQQREKPPL